MTNRIYEPTRNALESITNSDTNSSTTDPISASEYSVNGIGQRESVARSGSGTATPASASASYTYNERGELITANETTDALDRAYQFDGIGNREKTVAGSLTLPGTKNYTVNALNQYTVIPNLSATPAYDDDGNATAYPLPVNPAANATLTYDGENRLIKVVTASTTVEYTYDALSRRIIKTVGTQRTYYVYDGWNCISEYTGTKHTSGSAPTLTRTQSYTWGLDLSQSLQGAGGVGGLLAVTEIPVSSAPVTYYPLYDGNGNITAYIDESCDVEASFDYDPFGNITNNNNPLNFTYAFSTKPLEAETGLYYYGYRWYDPLTGRWPSRDPIGESGGVNLYGFVDNRPMGKIDVLGMEPWWKERNAGRSPEEIAFFARSCMDCHGNPECLRGLLPYTQPWFNSDSYEPAAKVVGSTLIAGAVVVGGYIIVQTAACCYAIVSVASYTTIYNCAEAASTAFEIAVGYDGPPILPGWGDPIRLGVNKAKSSADDLARYLQDIRVEQKIPSTSTSNLAVAEVFAGDDYVYYWARSVPAGPGVKPLHAEAGVLYDIIADGYDLSSITRFYSELEPCRFNFAGHGTGGGCSKMLKDLIPNVKVQFGYCYKSKEDAQKALSDIYTRLQQSK